MLAVMVAAMAVGGVLSAPAEAKKRADSIEDLTNFLLGPSYSQWLVGAVSGIATESERRAYLALTSDEAAAAFIDTFWESRYDPDRPWPAEQPRGEFNRRSEEADRLYTEGTQRGRRTPRGRLHILYGPPALIDYLTERPPRSRTIEVWFYPKGASSGLARQAPLLRYFFVRDGDLTVRHNPRAKDLLRPARPSRGRS